MARRKQGGFELIAAMPWWCGVVIGLITYIAIRHGIGWYFASTGDSFLSGLGKMAASGIYAPFAWIPLILCWFAAIASFIGRRRRRNLLDSQTGVDSLRQLSWRQFERLAGEAFRRQGYTVEETGLGGADGGIDLILRRDGQTTLVQCKQWQSRQVGVKVVREMYGLLVHHQAAAVKIVALGDYTPDAHRFAEDKPVELIHGDRLISTVRSVQRITARKTGPMDTTLALVASMTASLLVIAVLSYSTNAAPAPTAALAVAPAPAPSRHVAARPAPIPHAPSASATSAPQPTIYLSDSRNDPQLREWKKRNAESMKIMEKTTKELQRR